jgi:hypothetical protein
MGHGFGVSRADYIWIQTTKEGTALALTMNLLHSSYRYPQGLNPTPTRTAAADR